jgi:hypothetical protein
MHLHIHLYSDMFLICLCSSGEKCIFHGMLGYSFGVQPPPLPFFSLILLSGKMNSPAESGSKRY